MQNNNKGTIVFTTKFSYFIIVLPLKGVHYNKIQQQQHESKMISEIYTTATTNSNNDSNSFRILEFEFGLFEFRFFLYFVIEEEYST